MPNDETAPAPAPPASDLSESLARGLKLADALTTPPLSQEANAAEQEEAAVAPSQPAADSAKDAAPLPEERNGILFLFEGDLQYALPLNRKQLVDVGTAPHAFPHKCQWPACTAVEEAREEEIEKQQEEGAERGKRIVVTQTPRFPVCGQCHQARYCGREHQVEDWKAKGSGHKASCAQFAILRNCALGKDRLDRRDVVVKLLFKIRLHLGPYLVAHGDKQGKGFGFVQSGSTLEELSLLRPVGPRGQPLERSVVVHYLTMGEFVSVVLEDDWELITAKDPLEQALASYDPATHYLVLLKLRCGYVAVLRVPLLGVGLCRSLAADYGYAEHPELQLNID